MDAAFKCFGAVGSVGSDVLECGGGFVFQRLRVKSDEPDAFVVRSDSDFLIFNLLFDDF